MTRIISYLTITAIIVLYVLPAEAMNADTVVTRMKEAYQKQIENINDYTIVTNDEVKYHKKIIIEGKPVFLTRTEFESGGHKFVTVFDGEFLWSSNPMSGLVDKEPSQYEESELFESLEKAQIEYLGQEKLNGDQTHILYVKNLDLMMADDDDAQEEGYEGKVWIDAQDWIIRKMDLELDSGREEPTSMTVEIKDYRNFQGLLVPFITEVSVSNVLAEMTPEEEQEMRDSYAQMKRELEQMPAGQRAMIEQMMKPQIEAMESLLTGQGVMHTIEVKEVKVNTGLADSLFNGSLLGE